VPNFFCFCTNLPLFLQNMYWPLLRSLYNLLRFQSQDDDVSIFIKCYIWNLLNSYFLGSQPNRYTHHFDSNFLWYVFALSAYFLLYLKSSNFRTAQFCLSGLLLPSHFDTRLIPILHGFLSTPIQRQNCWWNTNCKRDESFRWFHKTGGFKDKYHSHIYSRVTHCNFTWSPTTYP